MEATPLNFRARTLGESVSAAIVLFAVATAAVACTGGDYDELYVTNNTQQEWAIRGPVGADYPDLSFVTRVEAGKRGVAMDLPRDVPDPQYELLDPSCRRVAVFQLVAPGTYAVPGVDIVLHRFSYGAHRSENQVPGVTHVEECGGVLFH